MNKISPFIGIKMKISANKEVKLIKGNNIFHSNIFLPAINDECKEDASIGAIVFSIKCINQQKAMLRTYKNFPMIIKQMEQKENKLISSQRYMNDSLVYLNDLSNIKILPLTENKADCILFESFALRKETNETRIKRERKRSGMDMEFLDKVIKLYNQDKNKESDSLDDYKKNGDKEEEIPHLSSTTVIINSQLQPDIIIKHNDYYLKSPPILSDNTKDDEIGIVNHNSLDQSNHNVNMNMNECSLRKQLNPSENKNHYSIIENSITKENKNNNVFLRRKRQRKASLAIKKCPICLEEIKENSQLDTCKHEFCKKCIDHWALVSSQCPCCKDNFKKIIYFNPLSHNTTEKKIKKKLFKPEEEEVEPWFANCDEKCYVCGKSDNSPLLLICDKCNFRICHTFCVGLDSIPDEDFICPECSNSSHQHASRRKGKQSKIINTPIKPNHHQSYHNKRQEETINVKRSLRLREKPMKKYSLRAKIKG